VQKSAQVIENKRVDFALWCPECAIGASLGLLIGLEKKWKRVTFGLKEVTPSPCFSVNADSKGLARGKAVSADSAGVKVAVFLERGELFVNADLKGVMGAICLQKGKQAGNADSKGFRRTAWRASMAPAAGEIRADSTKLL
jgi:hypothetical protein